MSREKISIEEVHQLLTYNPLTGTFQWRIDRGPSKAGDVAGCLKKDGYWQIIINGTNYLGHRLAWFMTMGEWPENEIDHINRNRSDNRFRNLRDVTRLENCENRFFKNRVVLLTDDEILS